MYFIGSNSNDRYNWRQANDNCRAQNAALLTNYVDISTDLLTFLRPITFQRGRDLGFWSGICSTGGTACEAIATNRGTMGSIMSLGEVQTSMTYNTNVCIRGMARYSRMQLLENPLLQSVQKKLTRGSLGVVEHAIESD